MKTEHAQIHAYICTQVMAINGKGEEDEGRGGMCLLIDCCF